MAARLGRHSILLQARALTDLKEIREPIVYDDFEGFVYSQDHPFGMGTPVGQHSWFVYSIDYAPHGRGGKKPVKHRAKSAGHRSRGAYRRAFARMINLLAPKSPGKLRVVSDEHPGYRAGLRGHDLESKVDHRTFANPERGPKGTPRSAKARRRDREMFAVDLLHKLIRHTMAHHRRETIAFGRRLNALLERGFLVAIWRNFVKRRTERRPDLITPAMTLGIADAPWSWERVLAKRLFPGRISVPANWRAVYRREVVTPIVGNNRLHALKNAF